MDARSPSVLCVGPPSFTSNSEIRVRLGLSGAGDLTEYFCRVALTQRDGTKACEVVGSWLADRSGAVLNMRKEVVLWNTTFPVAKNEVVLSS